MPCPTVTRATGSRGHRAGGGAEGHPRAGAAGGGGILTVTRWRRPCQTRRPAAKPRAWESPGLVRRRSRRCSSQVRTMPD